MDSQGRSDQSKIRRREEKLARRMGEALDQVNPHGAGECPDAEVIAAYAEQALGPVESAQWESHFAACARCRKILRVLAASADTPLAEKEVSQLGKLVSVARDPLEITGSSAGRARPRPADWRKRWLAPALGVAAALAVWFAMRPPWRGATERGASETLVAQAPKDESTQSRAPQETDGIAKVAPRQKEEARPAPPSGRDSANAQTLNSPVESLKKVPAGAAKAPDEASSNAGAVASSLQHQLKPNASASGREIQPAASRTAPPSPATAQSEMEASAGAQSKGAVASAAVTPGPVRADKFGSALGNPTARDKQAAPAQQAAGALAVPAPFPQAAARARNIQGLAALKAAEPAFIQATAPFGSTVWRLGKGGRIERSADGGETWNSQTSPILEDWLAGVALSDTVCWAAGSNGAIARTIDGEHWERVAPPAMAAGPDAKVPDWKAIAAQSAQSATITASDGRKFATADGGKTWQPQ